MSRPPSNMFIRHVTYECGEPRWNDIDRGNRRTQRKSCPSSNFSTINPTWTDPVANPGLRSERPATNRLSHVIAQTNVLTKYWETWYYWCSLHERHTGQNCLCFGTAKFTAVNKPNSRPHIVCLTPVLILSSYWSHCKPGSSVSIVSGYGLDDRATEIRFPAEAKGFFLYALCPDRLCGPPSLLYNGYRGSFPRG
jgi:hypothetical protein